MSTNTTWLSLRQSLYRIGYQFNLGENDLSMKHVYNIILNYQFNYKT